MQQLHYADESRPAEAVNERGVKESELKLAKQLIEHISSNEFRPEAYKDEVRERVRKQIQHKVKGEDITTEPAQRPKGKVLDLMEALKASLSKQGKRKEIGGRKPVRRAGGRRRQNAKRSSAA